VKAKIARVQIDIDYRCPNCYLHFRLTNDEIPQDKSIDKGCVSCGEVLGIAPVAFASQQVVSTAPEIKDSPDSLRAIKALQSQGYDKKEAQSRVRSAYRVGISISELIKEAISYEQST
jgi:hypothetical protein